MQKKAFLVALWMGCMGAVGTPGVAQAAPISYEFLVIATSGSLTGMTSTGSFTYDSSSIIPDGANTSAGLLTALDFTWNTIQYDQTTANTGVIFFDSAGEPTGIVFGSPCTPGGCGVGAGEENWYIAWFFGSYNDNATAFIYSTPEDGGVYEGSVSLALSPVTDPTILLGRLLIKVTGIGPGKSLADKVELAEVYYAANDTQATCAVLADFLREVNAQRGKKLTAQQADDFTAQATAIMDAIGCSE